MRPSRYVKPDAGTSIPIAASDFPGQAFRILKYNGLKQFGHSRTRRLALQAWGGLHE